MSARMPGIRRIKTDRHRRKRRAAGSWRTLCLFWLTWPKCGKTRVPFCEPQRSACRGGEATRGIREREHANAVHLCTQSNSQALHR